MEYELTQLPKQDTYRLLTHLVAPRPIAWVTSVSETGVVDVAPFSYFNLLGNDPPIVGIGVGCRRDGSPKDTARNIAHSREFVVNMVDEAVLGQMNITAIEFPFGMSELQEAGLTARPSAQVTAPRIAEAKAHLECRLTQIVRVGDNHIVLGQVVHLHLRDGESLGSLRPVARGGANTYFRTEDRFELPRLTLAEWQTQ